MVCTEVRSAMYFIGIDFPETFAHPVPSHNNIADSPAHISLALEPSINSAAFPLTETIFVSPDDMRKPTSFPAFPLDGGRVTV
jgi:hypothetical protein